MLTLTHINMNFLALHSLYWTPSAWTPLHLNWCGSSKTSGATDSQIGRAAHRQKQSIKSTNSLQPQDEECKFWTRTSERHFPGSGCSFLFRNRWPSLNLQTPKCRWKNTPRGNAQRRTSVSVLVGTCVIPASARSSVSEAPSCAGGEQPSHFAKCLQARNTQVCPASCYHLCVCACRETFKLWKSVQVDFWLFAFHSVALQVHTVHAFIHRGLILKFLVHFMKRTKCWLESSRRRVLFLHWWKGANHSGLVFPPISEKK